MGSPLAKSLRRRRRQMRRHLAAIASLPAAHRLRLAGRPLRCDPLGRLALARAGHARRQTHVRAPGRRPGPRRRRASSRRAPSRGDPEPPGPGQPGPPRGGRAS